MTGFLDSVTTASRNDTYDTFPRIVSPPAQINPPHLARQFVASHAIAP
jgi:hypothetical protein